MSTSWDFIEVDEYIGRSTKCIRGNYKMGCSQVECHLSSELEIKETKNRNRREREEKSKGKLSVHDETTPSN